MKLYFKHGACSLASRITLNELNIPFSAEAVDVAEGKTESGENFKEINPNGYVPVLEVSEGVHLSENTAILQFIADKVPGSSLAPANGTLERARLQEALSFAGSELHKAYSPFFRTPDMDEDQRNRTIENTYKKIQHIENQLADGRSYLLGETFTVADAYTAVILNWSNFIDLDINQFKYVTSYIDRVFSRPAVLKSLKEEGLVQEENA